MLECVELPNFKPRASLSLSLSPPQGCSSHRTSRSGKSCFLHSGAGSLWMRLAAARAAQTRAGGAALGAAAGRRLRAARAKCARWPRRRWKKPLEARQSPGSSLPRSQVVRTRRNSNLRSCLGDPAGIPPYPREPRPRGSRPRPPNRPRPRPRRSKRNPAQRRCC